jgi:F-type H+-transporting ATPase subunit alpha
VGGSAQVSFMKKISGGIKLALAQFRELEAFSQFASDLDDTTRRQLEHGQRVTELMKQKQYSPMSVAEMGVSLFAVNEGYLQDIEVGQVLEFEQGLLAYMNSEKSEFMKSVNDSGAFDDAIVEEMTKAIEAYKAQANF